MAFTTAELNQTQIPMSKKRKSLLMKIKKNYQLYVIISLPLLWLVIFRYVPMYGLQLAFKKFIASKGMLGSPWIGIDNFSKFFNYYQFGTLIKNTIGISLYSLVAGFPIPIILALALNTTLKGSFKKIVQFVTYMPHFISTVILVGMVMQFLSPKIGIINALIVFLGGSAKDYMGDPAAFKSIYVWSGIWQSAGWGSIVYLSALSSINSELHEAATIDGASRLKRIIHIDIPGILPTAIVILIMNTGHLMNVGFEKVFLMQNALNMSASDVIATYAYRISLASSVSDFSYATAIGLFNSVINLVLIMIVNQLSRKFSETSLW